MSVKTQPMFADNANSQTKQPGDVNIIVSAQEDIGSTLQKQVAAWQIGLRDRKRGASRQQLLDAGVRDAELLAELCKKMPGLSGKLLAKAQNGSLKDIAKLVKVFSLGSVESPERKHVLERVLYARAEANGTSFKLELEMALTSAVFLALADLQKIDIRLLRRHKMPATCMASKTYTRPAKTTLMGQVAESKPYRVCPFRITSDGLVPYVPNMPNECKGCMFVETVPVTHIYGLVAFRLLVPLVKANLESDLLDGNTLDMSIPDLLSEDISAMEAFTNVEDVTTISDVEFLADLNATLLTFTPEQQSLLLCGSDIQRSKRSGRLHNEHKSIRQWASEQCINYATARTYKMTLMYQFAARLGPEYIKAKPKRH